MKEVNSYGFEPRRLRILIFIGKTTLKRHSATGIHDSFMTDCVGLPFTLVVRRYANGKS